MRKTFKEKCNNNIRKLLMAYIMALMFLFFVELSMAIFHNFKALTISIVDLENIFYACSSKSFMMISVYQQILANLLVLLVVVSVCLISYIFICFRDNTKKIIDNKIRFSKNVNTLKTCDLTLYKTNSVFLC